MYIQICDIVPVDTVIFYNILLVEALRVIN